MPKQIKNLLARAFFNTPIHKKKEKTQIENMTTCVFDKRKLSRKMLDTCYRLIFTSCKIFFFAIFKQSGCCVKKTFGGNW